MRLLIAPAILVVLCAACGPVAYPPSDGALRDARLSASVKTALLNSPDIDATRIDVHATEGAVTLVGAVQSGEDAQQAIEIVRGVPGVVDVESKLAVKEKPVTVVKRSG